MPKKGSHLVMPQIRKNSPNRSGTFTRADVILARVKQRGAFTLMDMLTDDSIRNVLSAYKAIGGTA